MSQQTLRELLSMLGEYVVRTLNAVSEVDTYHVTERVSS